MHWPCGEAEPPDTLRPHIGRRNSLDRTVVYDGRLLPYMILKTAGLPNAN